MVNPKNEPIAAAPSPFDDDESSHSDGDASDSARWFSKWVRPSGTVAAISLGVAIVASIVSNNAAGDRNIEDLAFSINRFASLVMLLGCFGLLIGFRGARVVDWFTRGSVVPGSSASPISLGNAPTIRFLFLRSIVVSFVLTIVVFVLAIFSGEAAIIAGVAFYAIYFPLLVTSAVMRKGTARAFSLGMTANFVFLLVGCFGIGGVVLFQSVYWSYNPAYGGSYSYGYNYWRKAIPVIAVCGTQALMILSGLICAWYAHLLTRNNAEQVASPELTTLPLPSASGTTLDIGNGDRGGSQ